MTRPARGAPAPSLTVVVPTRDRAQVLARTLALLDQEGTGLPVEIVVVDDGSADGTPEVLDRWRVRTQLGASCLRQEPARGPAAARNAGLRAARGAAILFIGDDIRPGPGLLRRHLEFHAEHPEPEAAVLGRVVPAQPLDRSEFVVWLHEEGVQFGYARLQPGSRVGPTCFWTSNVSVKRSLLDRVGGFDEAFTAAACEDAELGVRLARAGMILRYDAAAVGQHDHPTDLARTLARMRTIGREFRLLGSRAPEIPMPSRPGRRHRLKAAALAAAGRGLPPPAPIRKRMWRFLCDEAQREAFWGWPPGPGGGPAIGAELVERAAAGT